MVANPVRRDVRISNIRKEVVKVSRTKTMPIDGGKLRGLIHNKGFYMMDMSLEMGYGISTLSQAIRRGNITNAMAYMLDNKYGIKYEDYAPKKEEPVIEKPATETEVISKGEALLKTIVAQLGALNNSLVAILTKLNEIDADIKVWE